MAIETTSPARFGKVYTLRIDSGDTDSDILDFTGTVKRIAVLLIQAPATLTGTVSVEVSLDGSTWAVLQSAGNPVTCAVSTGTVITDLPACFFRVNSSGAEGGNRDFLVVANSQG